MNTRARMQELVAVAAPSWAGEAEIVTTYLAAHRSPARDLVWLKAQAWKETRLLRVLSPAARATFAANGTVVAHPEGAPAEKFVEEMKHFRLIAEIIEALTGTRVALEDLDELAEETRLQALRAPFRSGTAFERALVDFTEGGGGAIYAVLGRLDRDALDRRIAAAFREIHDDEIFHGPAEIHTIARLARDDHDWRRAAVIVAAICRQRLRMRNEMFGAPLSDSRLEQIAAGAIEPWPLPIAL